MPPAIDEDKRLELVVVAEVALMRRELLDTPLLEMERPRTGFLLPLAMPSLLGTPVVDIDETSVEVEVLLDSPTCALADVAWLEAPC